MLTKYDAAKAALNAARSFEDVLAIKDKSEAYAAVAKVAKDEETVRWATEIKTRAERMAGEMLMALDLKPGRPEKNGNSELPLTKAKLAELKVEKIDSSRWQQLAKVPEKAFEDEIAAGHVSRAAIVRATAPKTTPRTVISKPVKPTVDKQPDCQNCRQKDVRIAELDKQFQVYVEICESDDKLAAAVEQVKQLTERLRQVEERNIGLQNEKGAAIKQSESWRRKAEKK